jgi:hypothetical protein
VNNQKAAAHPSGGFLRRTIYWDLSNSQRLLEWKMKNDCMRFAHDFKSFPKEIPQFSIAEQLHKRKFCPWAWVNSHKPGAKNFTFCIN